MSRLAWALIGLVVALAGAVAASVPLSSVGPLSRGFGGLSRLASESHIATSPGQVLGGLSRTVIVADPMLSPSQADLEALRSLLSAGGTVVVVGSGPAVNELLRGLGVNMETLNLTVMDLVSNLGSPFMIAVNTSGGLLALLNASPIALGPGAVAIANTSPLSFAVYPNGTQASGPFVVEAQQRVGRGLVVLVSSPYALSNGLINYSGNSALVGYAGAPGPYLAAFLWRLTPAQLLMLEASQALAPLRPYSPALAALAAVAAGAAAYYWAPGRPSQRSASDELAEALRRHPEWDSELLRRLEEERKSSR